MELYGSLNSGSVSNAFDLGADSVSSSWSRANQWLDASAYLSHVELARRGVEMMGLVGVYDAQA